MQEQSPRRNLDCLPIASRRLWPAMEKPFNWLKTLCPSGQGDGLEIHWALPAGARIPSVSLLGRPILLKHLWSSGYDVSLTH